MIGGKVETELETERRLQHEARSNYLGTLGDRSGANVAKVEVSWYIEYEFPEHEERAGYFLVHATGDEETENGTIYDTFDRLVSQEMNARQDAGRFDGWQTDDTYAA